MNRNILVLKKLYIYKFLYNPNTNIFCFINLQLASNQPNIKISHNLKIFVSIYKHPKYF